VVNAAYVTRLKQSATRVGVDVARADVARAVVARDNAEEQAERDVVWDWEVEKAAGRVWEMHLLTRVRIEKQSN
jgi:hypothetical protein